MTPHKGIGYVCCVQVKKGRQIKRYLSTRTHTSGTRCTSVTSLTSFVHFLHFPYFLCPRHFLLFHWNEVHKCAIHGCSRYYTATEGSCSCLQRAVTFPLADDLDLGAAGHSTDEVGAAVPPSIATSGRKKIVRGDVVSVSPTIFDGDKPGSYSNKNPERCYGVVQSVRANGLVSVEWENKDVDDVRLKDLKKEPTHTMSYQIY